MSAFYETLKFDHTFEVGLEWSSFVQIVCAKVFECLDVVVDSITF